MDIAIISPGGRVDKLTDPLDTTHHNYAVNPERPSGFDVVVCDTPDRGMLTEVFKHRFRNNTLLFRMRGDPFWGIHEWMDSKAKKWLAVKMLSKVDGCLAIAPHQAQKYERKTGVRTEMVSLPKRVRDWPTPDHTDRELRIVTLTNATYRPKIQPLIDIAPNVNRVLDEEGGTWRIGSWSEGHHEKLQALNDYEHIEFNGPLDAYDALEWANLMIHHSNFDVLANAILEGMASGLPVLTNDHISFTQIDAPLIISENTPQLERQLRQFTVPYSRQLAGESGMQYVDENHSPHVVGKQLSTAIEVFTGLEDQSRLGIPQTQRQVPAE